MLRDGTQEEGETEDAIVASVQAGALQAIGLGEAFRGEGSPALISPGHFVMSLACTFA